MPPISLPRRCPKDRRSKHPHSRPQDVVTRDSDFDTRLKIDDCLLSVKRVSEIGEEDPRANAMTRACTVGRLADGPFNRRRREVDQTYGWCMFAKDWQAEHAACSEPIAQRSIITRQAASSATVNGCSVRD